MRRGGTEVGAGTTAKTRRHAHDYETHEDATPCEVYAMALVMALVMVVVLTHRFDLQGLGRRWVSVSRTVA